MLNRIFGPKNPPEKFDMCFRLSSAFSRVRSARRASCQGWNMCAASSPIKQSRTTIFFSLLSYFAVELLSILEMCLTGASKQSSCSLLMYVQVQSFIMLMTIQRNILIEFQFEFFPGKSKWIEARAKWRNNEWNDDGNVTKCVHWLKCCATENFNVKLKFQSGEGWRGIGKGWRGGARRMKGAIFRHILRARFVHEGC